MHSNIEQTLHLVQSAQKAWDEAFSLLQDSGLNLDRSYPSLHRSTINELNERLAATFLLADGLRSVEESGLVLLRPRLPNLEGPLSQIQQHSEAATSGLRSYADSTLSDPSGNLTVHVIRAGSVFANWGLSTHLDSISAQQTALFDQLTLGLRFGRYKGVGLFQERARELQGMAAELGQLLVDSRLLAAELAGAVESGKSQVEEAQEHVEAAETRKDQIASLATAAQQTSAEIEAKLARIKEITKASDALSTQVEEYEGSFAAFQESIDARLAAHEKFEQDMMTCPLPAVPA